MRVTKVVQILLSVFLIAGLLVIPALAYSSASEIIPPASLVTQGGSISGNPISVLESLQQSGTDDNPETYLILSTPNEVYTGYQEFQLPANVVPATVTNLLLQVNFKGAADSTQVWTWSVYRWQSNLWIKLGDTIGTKPGEWNDLVLPIRNFHTFLSPAREIRIQVRSSNSTGDAKIDYEAIHITYIPVPPTPTRDIYTIPTHSALTLPASVTPTEPLPPTSTPTSTNISSQTPSATPTLSPKSTSAPCSISIPSTIQKGQNPYTSTKTSRKSLLYIPAAYGNDPRKVWPLIVFLHGAGTRGSNLNLLKYEALPQTLQTKTDFPAMVLSPQLTTQSSDDFWTNKSVTDSLFLLMGELQQKYCIDPKRIYLTGFSLGGEGTWGIGLNFPTRFAALVPVAGFYGNTASQWVPGNICNLKSVPVWAFHGEKDAIVPLKAEADLVNALRACGGNVQFTVYPGASHDISGQVYVNNDSLYTWLFSQTLP